MPGREVTTMTKYPHVEIALTDGDDPFAILARTIEALRAAGTPEPDIATYVDQATDGDYQYLLTVTRLTVTTREDPPCPASPPASPSTTSTPSAP
jgi:hypothetical protein